jgi:outer membrane protein OmpA-like peptidoglycan-associated protein
VIRKALLVALLAGPLSAAPPAAAFAAERTDEAATEVEAAVPPPPPPADSEASPDPTAEAAAEMDLEPAAAPAGDAAGPVDAATDGATDGTVAAVTGSEPGDRAATQADETRTGDPAAPASPAMTRLTSLRLLFGEESVALSEETELELQALAGYLDNNRDQRVQLLAYAGAADRVGSRARRLSLSRALAVRAFLADKGIEPTRIDIRPLGSEVEDGPADRVDVLPADR